MWELAVGYSVHAKNITWKHEPGPYIIIKHTTISMNDPPTMMIVSQGGFHSSIKYACMSDPLQSSFTLHIHIVDQEIFTIKMIRVKRIVMLNFMVSFNS